MTTGRNYNESYTGEHLNQIAFPLGGIGAGMICLDGTGSFSHVSLRHSPDVFSMQPMFAAIHVRDHEHASRVLEGPVPARKIFGAQGTGNGGGSNMGFGFPHFDEAEFSARFPFAAVSLSHPAVPLECSLVGWSPFIPGQDDDSSLPMAALTYRFTNPGDRAVEAVFSFHARNLMIVPPQDTSQAVESIDGGFLLSTASTDEHPELEGYCAISSPDPKVKVDCRWFRGSWFDAKTIVWQHVQEGHAIENAPSGEPWPGAGGSLYVPFSLGPGEQRDIPVVITWYVPKSALRAGGEAGEEAPPDETYVPHYATRFDGIRPLHTYAREHYERLLHASAQFRDAFYDSTLPPEIVEAAAGNLTILKSPTVLREREGRLWCWEGCCDGAGCCAGSCTHVWNYAQAIPHLFPALERSLRRTEFNENQDERGHQAFRAWLPIRPTTHDGHAAADGQLGGIMKAHRDWRISGDTAWLESIWPKVRKSLEYCIETWDPDHRGALFEPHHNTYDIEFWGPDGMCTSFYLGALRAASRMAGAVGEDAGAFDALYQKGRTFMESELWNGEYFIQKVMWKELRAPDPTEFTPLARHHKYSPEAQALLEQEGPKYQYGNGCLADGVLGTWLAMVCGVGEILDREKVRCHLLAVHRHNFRPDLSEHVNPQRPTYALGHEGGLILCTWPRGNALSLPFPYSNEVWTGFEYQVASHLMMVGHAAEALQIVRAARDRYDGRVRNPFNEYECGHWYARALSSYGMLQGLTGVWYDAIDRTLTIRPAIKGDFRTFLSTATGFGTAGVRNGEPFVDVVEGTIEVDRIDYSCL